MDDALKYKMTGRYAVGWTDPRGFFATTAPPIGMKFGDYYIVDLGIHMLHFYHNSFRHGAKKEEFAVFVEAFFKEKKSENINGGLRDALHKQGLGVQDSDN